MEYIGNWNIISSWMERNEGHLNSAVVMNFLCGKTKNRSTAIECVSYLSMGKQVPFINIFVSTINTNGIIIRGRQQL